MADWEFGKAESWAELQHVHDRWVENYNHEEHWAHQHKREGRRTPAGVLSWVIGTPHDPELLARLFAPLRYERRLDKEGYVQFRRWRVYGNRALPKQRALVWLSDETLTVGTSAEPLAYYTVNVNRWGELTAVTVPRLLPARYQAPQLQQWGCCTSDMSESPKQPTAARRRAMSTGESAAELLRKVEDEQAALRAALAGLEPSVVAVRPPSGKWSVIENVRHLLFAEQLHLGGFGASTVTWSAYGFNPEAMRRQRKLPPVGESPAFRLHEVLAAWEEVHADLRRALHKDSPQLRQALERHLGHLRRHIEEIERLLRWLATVRA